MKPILFNTAMVQAILEGRKTVTRRVIKPQPAGALRPMGAGSCWPGCFEAPGEERIYRPPYQPGDILYVRETWQAVYETEWDESYPFEGKNIRKLILNFDSIPKVEAGISKECSSDAMKPRMKYFVFKASNIQYADIENKLVWRPSIHMPREAARIFLQVTAVRAARLQEIEKEDVLREGVEPKYYAGGCKCAWAFEGCMEKPCTNRDGYIDLCHWMPFSELWDKTMKPADRSAYSWEANPWVGVIEFERISREEAER